MEMDDYALAVNVQLNELDLYPQFHVATTVDWRGTPYLLLFLGGAPLVHTAPATSAPPQLPREATAPDLWNLFAAYRQDTKRVIETAPGVWAICCDACPLGLYALTRPSGA